MAIGNMHKKFGEDGTCSSEDMIVDRQTYTHRQTDRHAHHNTPLPYRGRSNKQPCMEYDTMLLHKVDNTEF